MKKQMDIENLLRWAFVHELPKGRENGGGQGIRSAWEGIYNLGVLGTLVQTDGFSGGGFIEPGEPHRDATLIGEAVRGLEGMEIGGFEDWDAFADVPELAAHMEGVSARVAARMAAMPAGSRARLPVTLTISAAVTGRGPDWRWPEEPRARMVERSGKPAWFVKRAFTDAFGRRSAIETDGFDARAGRPLRGAYRKYVVAPDPWLVALARMDWQVWVLSLATLAAELDGCLADWDVVAAQHSPTPWVDGEAATAPRVLEAVK